MPTFGSPTIEDYINDLKESIFPGSASNKIKPFITKITTDYGIFEVDTNQNEKDVNRDVYAIANDDIKIQQKYIYYYILIIISYKLLLSSLQNTIKQLIYDISDDDSKVWYIYNIVYIEIRH